MLSTLAGQSWNHESPLIQGNIPLDTNVGHVIDAFCKDRSIWACRSSCGLRDLNIEQIILWLLKHLEELRNIQTVRQQYVLYGHTYPTLNVKICSLYTEG